MNRRLIECVPNISEGRDRAKIDAIAAVVETVEGVRLLDVDPGKATNRTVITFVGEPGPVCEAAFRLIKKAQELIDMRTHKGEHPRFGATDVCPLVPISGISMEETARFARGLAERVANELNLSVQTLEGLVIQPRIIGDRVGLHPMTIIVALMVGTTLLGGILGGILAIPLTAALRALMFRYVWRRK